MSTMSVVTTALSVLALLLIVSPSLQESHSPLNQSEEVVPGHSPGTLEHVRRKRRIEDENLFWVLALTLTGGRATLREFQTRRADANGYISWTFVAGVNRNNNQRLEYLQALDVVKTEIPGHLTNSDTDVKTLTDLLAMATNVLNRRKDAYRRKRGRDEIGDENHMEVIDKWGELVGELQRQANTRLREQQERKRNHRG